LTTISKTLSANDIGLTGGHQAGILIPKVSRLLAFFPPLDPAERNPRAHLSFVDGNGKCWELAFIYYNNGLYGGTRNEYRLTRLTRFIREAGLEPGDEISLSRTDGDRWRISYERKDPRYGSHGGSFTLKLGSGWKFVSI
jgi:hypothetical protein